MVFLRGRVKGLTTVLKANEDALKAFAERELIARAEQALTLLIIATPVDTGRARGSWSLNYQGDLYDIAVTDSPPRTVNPAAFQGRVFITNGTPYIEVLNEGRSPQADPGFIEEIILRVFSKAGPVVVIPT